jgi:hypothetical protein
MEQSSLCLISLDRQIAIELSFMFMVPNPDLCFLRS